jgi:ornithine decarboxylase
LGYNPSRSGFIAGVRSSSTSESHYVPVYPSDIKRDAAIRALAPALPCYVKFPKVVYNKALSFKRHFVGTTMYAVKCNTDPLFLQQIYRAGVREFDVASIKEIALIHGLFPDAKMHFMHTIKPIEAIRRAYFDYGIRDFSLDCMEELDKILEATNNAPDLSLFVRFAPPKNVTASIDFSSKFGCSVDEAVALLKAARPVSQKLGLAFHVGTQTTDMSAYTRALDLTKRIIKQADVAIEALDIGGGFAVDYPDSTAPQLENSLFNLNKLIKHMKLDHLELYAEPGRIMVAEGTFLVVRVEQRKGDLLYINDGTYGGLFDAGKTLGQQFAVRHIPAHPAIAQAHETAFRLAGPTCDSLDMMDGPFLLPDNIKTGDWIEIKNLGAYSQVLRTAFNGFEDYQTLEM